MVQSITERGYRMGKFVFITLLLAGMVLALPDSGSLSTPTLYPIPAGVDSTGEGELTTQFNENNNFAGNSFDLEAIVDIVVVGWDINIDTVVPLWTVHVYWREGTAIGFEQTTAGWTHLGVDSVAGNGANQPTHIDIGGLEIASGDLIGIMITAEEAVSGTGGFFYTNGGPTTYSNSDLSLTTYNGLADGFPAGSVFSYREWNGTVHYDYSTAIAQSTWGTIKATF